MYIRLILQNVKKMSQVLMKTKNAVKTMQNIQVNKIVK